MTIERPLTAGVLAIALSACAHAGPAQVVLADLADSARSGRSTTATAMVGVGMAIGVASGLLLMDTEFGISGLMLSGVANLAAGVASFVHPINLITPYEIGCTQRS